MKSKIMLVISREYILRVRKKGFIITTLLFPVLLAALMFAPALLSGSEQSRPSSITVVDKSGDIAPQLLTSGHLTYKIVTDDLDSVMARNDSYPLLVLNADAGSGMTAASFYSYETPSMETAMLLKEDIGSAVETLRLKDFGIENLDEILSQVKTDVWLDTVVLNNDGTQKSSDAMTGMIVGMAMSFILYMFLLIYGQIVMHSVIEEKNNRVLELIVSSIKPTQLMVGKIAGVGLVAITQVVIWGAIICGFVEFGLPAILGADTMAAVNGVINGTIDPATANVDMSIVQMVSMVGSLGYIFNVFGYMIIYLAGGFMLYASIYAAIGASVDNAQDGAQLQTFATFPIIIAMVLSMTIAQDPNSTMAQWLSIIPFTSPMVMMCRIPSGVPAGEIILSLVLLIATVVFMLWLAAKIYRVGIFMYGKKPSLKELLRWARYK